jgi:hypothetical protein
MLVNRYWRRHDTRILWTKTNFRLVYLTKTNALKFAVALGSITTLI